MERLPTRLDGPLLLQPRTHGDERGFLAETYRRAVLAEMGIEEEFVQDNHSRSARGVLRGIHFAAGRGQSKLVRCARGSILDVLVDLRRGSPTFAQWEGFELDDRELRILYCPVGFGHGFCVTSDHQSPLPTLGPRGAPVDKSDCRKNAPGALRVFEGMAVGWGDIYIPAKEGQYVDITNVAPGTYDLVHRVNVGRLLRETNYANDSSSLRIRLLPASSPTDLPGVVVLKSCETGTHC